MKNFIKMLTGYFVLFYCAVSTIAMEDPNEGWKHTKKSCTLLLQTRSDFSVGDSDLFETHGIDLEIYRAVLCKCVSDDLHSLASLSLVCTSWKRMLEEQRTYIDFTFSSNLIFNQTNLVINFIKKFPGINSLTVSAQFPLSRDHAESYMRIGIEGLGNLTCLKKLTFNGHFNTDFLFGDLITQGELMRLQPIEIFDNLPHLNYLKGLVELEFKSYISGSGRQVPCFWNKILPYLPKLETLIAKKGCETWNLHPFVLKHLKTIDMGQLCKQHGDDENIPECLQDYHFIANKGEDGQWILTDIGGSSSNTYVQYCMKKLNE